MLIGGRLVSKKLRLMSLRSMPVMTEALLLAKEASLNRTVRLLISSASRWDNALPLKLSRAVVSLVRMIAAVRPSGTLEMVTPPIGSPLRPVNKPFSSVISVVWLKAPLSVLSSTKFVVE